MTDLSKLEYRVKEKTVYFITRYCEVDNAASVTNEGSFNDSLSAHRAAHALAKLEAESWGISHDDERITFPSAEYSELNNLSDG